MPADTRALPAGLPDRLWLVDDLRGIAALVIVIFHYHHFYLADAFDRPNLPPNTEFPYAAYIGPLYSPWAANAVELFWVISGVVFAHVYFARATTLWQFAVARFARLYPLHLVMLLTVAALQAISLAATGVPQVYENNDIKHFLLHLVMASNSVTLSEGLSFNGPVWSVSLEIPVYGLFFLSLFTFRRRPMATAIVMGALCWTLAFGNVLQIKGIRPSVFECGGYFFAGVFLWSLDRRCNGRGPLMAAALGTCAALALAGALADMPVVLTAVAASTLVLATLALDRYRRARRAGVPLLGDLSYAIYIVHVPIQIAMLLIADLFFDRDRTFADSALTLPLFLALTLGVAWTAHRYLELPAGRAIRHACLPQPQIQAQPRREE